MFDIIRNSLLQDRINLLLIISNCFEVVNDLFENLVIREYFAVVFYRQSPALFLRHVKPLRYISCFCLSVVLEIIIFRIVPERGSALGFKISDKIVHLVLRLTFGNEFRIVLYEIIGEVHRIKHPSFRACPANKPLCLLNSVLQFM